MTFNSNGGSAVAAQEVSSGGLVTKPADLTKSGNTFGGWYKEAGLTTAWNFVSDVVMSNITLYAKWNSSGGTLQGYVYYSANFTDISAKNVLVTIGGNSTYTDASGYYSISNIAAGTYTVTADFHSVTNTSDPIPTGASMGSSLYYYDDTWNHSVGTFSGSKYNDVVLGTKNEITITDGTTTTLKIRLAGN